MTTSTIGKRQVTGLTLLYIALPGSLYGSVVGEALDSGANNTHKNMALQALWDRGLIQVSDNRARGDGLVHRRCKLTPAGLEALRRWLRVNKPMAMEVWR